jgi:type I restriction enzyme, S subunit
VNGETLFQVARADRDWEPLGDVCRRGGGDIQTGPFGSQLHASDYVQVGVPSIMPQNISQDRVDADGIARITPSDAERLTRYLVKPGDIVYSRRGDVARRALITEKEDGWLCGTGCLRVRFGDGVVDPVYASYFLSHPASREWVVRHAVGATMPNLNTSILGALPFLLPSLPDQHAIAAVLGALDDKIEQNRRTAQALEKLAQAIFRAWFVDFEPVKAKAAGAASFPSMPQEVFDALPTRFTDSEIGPVPEGWEVKAIGDVVTTKGGGTPSTNNPEYWDGEYYWATPKDMSRLSHPVLLDTERRITDAGVESINSGILPVGTVLMSSRAPVGYLAIAGVPTAINQGFIAMVCDGPLPSVYVLNWAFISMETIKAHASGTTFPEISKKSFRPLPIIQPTDDVIVAYQQVAEPLFNLLVACVRESRQLAAMRDYLLPKLLSGAVRVRTGA